MAKELYALGGAGVGFLAGYLVKTAVSRSDVIPAIDSVFDETLIEVESPEIDCSKYRKFTAFINIDSVETPEKLVIEVFFWNGVEWKKYGEKFWSTLIYIPVQTPVAESLSGDILGNLMKIRAISSGTSSTNNFQLNLKIQMS